MTILPSPSLVMNKVLRLAKELALRDDGKVHGPLEFFTIKLGVNEILDDEWKRALALGLMLAVIGFLVALIGNMLFPDPEEEDSQDQEPLHERDERVQYILESWKYPQDEKSFDGSSSEFLKVLNQYNPRWWTTLRKEGVAVATELYSRLESSWIKSHKFQTPLALNCLLCFIVDPDDCIQLVEAEAEEEQASEGKEPNGSMLAEIMPRTIRLFRFVLCSSVAQFKSQGVMQSSLIKVEYQGGSESSQIYYALFLDRLTKELVITIRVTSDFHELLTCSLGDETTRWGGVVHEALLARAESIAKELGDTILTTLQNQSYERIVISGYSIGGGIAILLALVLRETHSELESFPIDCFTFGAPPVVGPPEHFSQAYLSNKKLAIHSFVNNDDVVPRTSMQSLNKTFRAWVAMDSELSIPAKLKSIFDGKLDPKVLVHIKEKMEIKHEDDCSMFTPGTLWVLAYNQGGSKVIRLADNAQISSQPMFLGELWQEDHRLQSYQAVLERM